jgi:ribose 5-phosphate isomerase A
MASPGATGRERQPPLSGDDPYAAQKRDAARAAAQLLQDGMKVGLGTGSTVAHLLPAIAERGLRDLRCVATSPATEHAALALGLTIESLDELRELDLAIDGADQVDPDGWLVKGGGGAHTREKIVAYAAERFVVIVSADKVVSELSAPVPLELVPFAAGRTLQALGQAQLRSSAPPSPDGGLIADYLGPVDSPATLAARLSATPGVVEHGLFEPDLVSLVLVGGPDGVLSRPIAASG